jgi:hypothetical protein
MRYLKYLALLAVLAAFCAIPSQAQVSIGVQIGPSYGFYNVPPVCPYGYYPDYPFGCAPYGYWGPEWFVDGVFIGAGPWYHFYYVHPALYRRWYGPGFVYFPRGERFRRFDRDDWRFRHFDHDREFRGDHDFRRFDRDDHAFRHIDRDRGFRDHDRDFRGDRDFRRDRGFRHDDRGFHGDRGFREHDREFNGRHEFRGGGEHGREHGDHGR